VASSVAMILAVTGVERRTVDLRVKIHGIHGECHCPHHGERDHLPMGAGLVPHSSGQMIQSRPQQSHCSTLRKTVSDPGLRRSPSEGLCVRRPHPTGHATRTGLFPPQVFVEDDGHPEDEEPRTEMKTQPRERGESPKQESTTDTSTSVAPMTSNDRSHLNLLPSLLRIRRSLPDLLQPHALPFPPTVPPCTAGSPWVGAPTGWDRHRGAGHVLRRRQPAWVGQWHLAFHPVIDDRRDRGQVPDAAW